MSLELIPVLLNVVLVLTPVSGVAPRVLLVYRGRSLPLVQHHVRRAPPGATPATWREVVPPAVLVGTPQVMRGRYASNATVVLILVLALPPVSPVPWDTMLRLVLPPVHLVLQVAHAWRELVVQLSVS
jgi:hypothetical protein